MDRAGRERAIRNWFSMWLEGKAGDLTVLFTPGCAVYRELGAGVPRRVPGPALVPRVEHPWAGPGLGAGAFSTTGTALWRSGISKNVVDGRTEEFDGLSLIHWSRRWEDPAASGVWLSAGSV